MASTSLDLYGTNAEHQVFTLVSTSIDGAHYKVANRPMSTPTVLEISRKIKPGVAQNDHVLVRLARSEQNVSTGKIATFQVLLDISIPKDQSILTPAECFVDLGKIASLLNDGAAMAATVNNRAALVDGRDV